MGIIASRSKTALSNLQGPSCLDTLGILDSGFGMIPIVAAIKEFANSGENNLDIEEFIIRMRQFMALEEGYCGPHHDAKVFDPSNLARPDELLFESGINYSLIQNYRKKIFNPLIPDFFQLDKPDDYSLIKKSWIPNQPQLPNKLKEALDLPDKTISGIPLTVHIRTINKESHFIDRLVLTTKFSLRVDNIAIKHFAIKNKPNLEKSINSYRHGSIFSLAGTVRKIHNQTVFYAMTWYQKDVSLNVADQEIDEFLPLFLKDWPNARNLLKECAQLCDPYERYCYYRKILARPPNSNYILVVFLFAFSRTVAVEASSLNELYDYVTSELKGWEVWMYLHGIRRFYL